MGEPHVLFASCRIVTCTTELGNSWLSVTGTVTYIDLTIARPTSHLSSTGAIAEDCICLESNAGSEKQASRAVFQPASWITCFSAW